MAEDEDQKLEVEDGYLPTDISHTPADPGTLLRGAKDNKGNTSDGDFEEAEPTSMATIYGCEARYRLPDDDDR